MSSRVFTPGCLLDATPNPHPPGTRRGAEAEETELPKVGWGTKFMREGSEGAGIHLSGGRAKTPTTAPSAPADLL